MDSMTPLTSGPSQLLIKHLLHTPLACSANNDIVYAKGRRHDYRTFARRLGQLANGLSSLGVKPGDVVAVMDWDSHRYLECFFAVPMMGAVLHTVNIRLSPEQILFTINHARDDWLLIHQDFIPLLAQIYDRIERPMGIVLLSDEQPSPEVAMFAPLAEYEALLDNNDAQFAFPDFDENTRATTFYTTGTTGDPKGVYYSHRQIVVHTLALGLGVNMSPEQGRFHRGDVYMPITPMFHVHAWGIPYVATLLGVKQVYPGRYEPARLLELIRDEEVTFSHCVPTILHMLLSDPIAATVDLSRWKVVIGGAAMPRGLATAALNRGIDVYGGYGMSETCPVLTLAQLDPVPEPRELDAQLTLRCRTGRALPLVDLSVVDETMQTVPSPGDVGEVVVRAPWLTEGYLNDPDRSAELWRGGALHTGDLGFIDEAGYLQVTDRLKDVIKSGGEWISSLTLESIVSQHPGVSEAAAVGIADERWGERPLVLVVAKADVVLAPEALRQQLQQRADEGVISRYAVPEQILVVESIPKTSVGKIDKKRIRSEFA